MKKISHYFIGGIVMCVSLFMGPRAPHPAMAQTQYVVETNTVLECQSLQPITQPSAMGSTATISSTYWVLSVNFQSLGNYADATSPAGYFIGPIGCLKILGRDPAKPDAPYQVLYSRYVDCRFVTKAINGIGVEGANFGGKGLVTYGEPTLNAAQWDGTGSGRWRPVTFGGGAYVTCPLDLKGWVDYELVPLPNSTQYATLDLVQPLKHFSMATFGAVAAGVSVTSPNPLLTYVPDKTVCGTASKTTRGCGVTSLSVPEAQNPFVTLSSRFNGITTTKTQDYFLGTPLQYWHSEFTATSTTTLAPVFQGRYDATSAPLVLTNYAGTTVGTLNPGYFRLWTGKTLLYIGKDPALAKDSFEGTLYEIIVDPSGDSHPPAH